MSWSLRGVEIYSRMCSSACVPINNRKIKAWTNLPTRLIQIAVHGKNFCVSAKDAFFLLMRNILR